MMDNKGIFGLNMLQLFGPPVPHLRNPMMEALDPLMERFEDRSLRVIVGKSFPLAQGGEAHAYLQSRKNIGKVVLLTTPKNGSN
jgi:NADPH:quinone reductase-like Zn-dependent oxidoreductase